MNEALANFRRLSQFSGREPRRVFWPYVAMVLVAYFVLSQIAAVPLAAQMMSRMAAIVSDPALQAAANSGDLGQMQRMMGRMMPDVRWLALIGLVGLVLEVMLLAAAVSRRLHDTGRSAWWGVLPLPFSLITLALLPGAYAAILSLDFAHLGSFMALMLVSTLRIAATVVLIVLLCLPTKTEPKELMA